MNPVHSAVVDSAAAAAAPAPATSSPLDAAAAAAAAAEASIHQHAHVDAASAMSLDQQHQHQHQQHIQAHQDASAMGLQSDPAHVAAAAAAAGVVNAAVNGAQQQQQQQQQQQPTPPPAPTPGVNTQAAANSIFGHSTVNAAAAAAAAAAQQAAQLNNTQRKSTKASWTLADDLELIRQLRLQREQHDNASKANGGTPSILGNRGITWSNVEAGMEKYRQEKGSSEGRYDSLACRNRWQLLLLQYRVVADIRNQPGFVWSDTEGARMVPSHLWDNWLSQLDTAHKIRIAKIFRLKGYPLFNEVAALAGDPAFLSGSGGPSTSQYPSALPPSGSKPATPAAQRARASVSGPNGQYNTPATGTQWSASKRRNTGNGSAPSEDASFALSDSSFSSPALDPNEQLIQQAQRRVRGESSGLSITEKVTLTNLFRQDLTAVWTYMAIGDNEGEFRLAWLKEEVERVNSRKANGIPDPTSAPVAASGLAAASAALGSSSESLPQ